MKENEPFGRIKNKRDLFLQKRFLEVQSISDINRVMELLEVDGWQLGDVEFSGNEFFGHYVIAIFRPLEVVTVKIEPEKKSRWLWQESDEHDKTKDRPQ